MKSSSTKRFYFLVAAIAALFLLPSYSLGQADNSIAKAENDVKAQPSSSSSATAHDDSFQIGPDDVLAINVWKEPEISRAVPVRSDGKISLPLVGELQASGQTPRQLEQEIAKKL